MKKVVTLVVIIVVVLAVLFVPMIPVGETYNETEPYVREARYQVFSAILTEHWEPLGREVYHASEVTVKNIDSNGGTFTVTHSLYDVDGLYGSKTTSDYIAPGDTKVLRAEFDTQAFQDVRAEYSVSAPTVTDERVVTKTRTIRKSIFEILIP